ncbi:hypothetical protein PMAYCL1PPCAC_18767, partial [Pristionchus mayeri]
MHSMHGLSLHVMRAPSPEVRGSSLSPISTIDGEVDPARVPLLSPLPSSDGLGGSHVTIDMSDGDGKPVKTKVKRKETATSSFTNFFQRFSRSSAEIKTTDDHHRLERGDQPLLEEEETVFVERPDTLQIPDEEQWFESRTSFDPFLGSNGWKTALTPRTIAVIDETRAKPMTPHPDGDRLESNEEMQKALEVLLEDFKCGNMGGLSNTQMAQLDATRRAHEMITDTHLKLASEAWQDTVGDKEEVALRESFNRMYDMLISMSDRVHPPSPSGPSPPADTAAAPTESSSNEATPSAGPSVEVEVGSASMGVLPLSVASSSSVPSPSSSQQPSPSPSGVKYENSKELKQLRDKIENLGGKGNWAEQSELLRNNESILVKNYPLLEEFLVNLDPAHSTAAIVYTLAIIVDVACSRKMEREMMRAAEILKAFVEQKTFVREQVMVVIDCCECRERMVLPLSLSPFQFVNGIPFVSGAIDGIVDEGDQTVTSLHGFLFILCLKAHAIGPGLAYLYPYIKGILPETNPGLGAQSSVESRALLSYLYYGGLLAARATQWKKSASLLKAACFIPGYAVSEIQIEALKKLHVISYIAYGNLSIPNRSPNLIKAFKQQGAVYSQMAAELEGGAQPDWDEEISDRGYCKEEPLSTGQVAERAKIVQKYLTSNKKMFEKDQNMELLIILMREFKLRAVLRIAELYKVASLTRITEMAKLENMEETKEVL